MYKCILKITDIHKIINIKYDAAEKKWRCTKTITRNAFKLYISAVYSNQNINFTDVAVNIISVYFKKSCGSIYNHSCEYKMVYLGFLFTLFCI